FRSVSPEQPIFSAIDWMAAHCEEYSLSCSNTIRTARSRTSGEYFFALVMTPISQRLEPPANPGRFKQRGLTGVDLVVSDHHGGLVNAIPRHFQGASWQRCQVHLMRNV